MFTEIKFILSNFHISGAPITRKVVVVVENGLLSDRCPEKMAKNAGSIAY